MSFTKIDEKQKGLVIVLVVVLLGSIGVTVMRTSAKLKETRLGATIPEKEVEEAGSTRRDVAVDSSYRPDRNPFAVPVEFQAHDDSESPVVRRADAMASNYSGGASDLDIGPMPVGNLQAVKDGGEGFEADFEEEPLPEMELTATIGSKGEKSAVIKINDSKEIVVTKGQMVEGKYKVVSIEDDKTVLTDGREKIIAKRQLPWDKKNE